MSRNVLGVAAVQMFFGGLFMTLAGTADGGVAVISVYPRARWRRWFI